MCTWFCVILGILKVNTQNLDEKRNENKITVGHPCEICAKPSHPLIFGPKLPRRLHFSMAID